MSLSLSLLLTRRRLHSLTVYIARSPILRKAATPSSPLALLLPSFRCLSTRSSSFSLLPGKWLQRQSEGENTSDVSPDYDVFLSFRGPDTRRSFSFSVYKILTGAGFRVFWDDDCLPISKSMEGQLIRALRASKVAIPVISPHYAESVWCLRELTEMLSLRKQQKQRVFPVFYQVDPDEIWGSHGCFEGALRELEGLFPAEDVNLWRESLKTVAAIKGLNPETAEGYEAGMAKMLLEKVQCDHRRRWVEGLPEKLKSGYLRFFGKKRPRMDFF